MPTTIDKYSVQIGVNGTALAPGLDAAGKMVEKKTGEVNKKLAATTGKGFELKADMLAKVGIMASGGAILDKLTEGNEALRDMVDATKTIALGWAVGGAIGAGVGAAVVAGQKLAESWDSVWQKMSQGKSLNLADQIAGGLQIIGGANPERKAFFAAEEVRNARNDDARKSVESLKTQFAAKILQADPETMDREADAFAKLATISLNGADNINQLRRELAETYELAKGADFVMNIRENTKALERQADTFGMTAEQIARYDAKLNGANESHIDFQRITEAGLKLESKQINAKDPLRQFDLRKNRLQEMFRGGYISAERFNDQLAEAGKLLDKLSEKTGPNLALQAGSAAGVAALNQARRDEAGGGDKNQQKAMLQALKEGNQIAAEMRARIVELRQVMGDQVVDIMGL